MIRIADDDTSAMLCRLVDMDDIYAIVTSASLGFRQAHLLLAGLGGFVVEYRGERVKLGPGQTLEMPSMADYIAISAKLDTRPPAMLATLAAADAQAAAFATQNHPEGGTFTAAPVAPQGARLVVLARKPKRV